MRRPIGSTPSYNLKVGISQEMPTFFPHLIASSPYHQILKILTFLYLHIFTLPRAIMCRLFSTSPKVPSPKMKKKDYFVVYYIMKLYIIYFQNILRHIISCGIVQLCFFFYASIFLSCVNHFRHPILTNSTFLEFTHYHQRNICLTYARK